MLVHVQIRGLPRTERLVGYVRRRVEFALDRFEDRIRVVTVRIEDMNGPRGGRDMQCKVSVKPIRGARVVASVVRHTAAAAADGAAHAVARAFRKSAERRVARARRNRPEK
jgi:putative sigma-54 modulation protein